MNELKEIRVNDQRLLLNENLVKSSILPRVASELERDVVIQGNTVIEGAVFARYFEVQQGNLEVKGAVFTQMELHVNTDAKGTAKFEKSVGSVDSVVCLAPGCRVIFQADINAKQVKLRNAFVAGSIFADEIVLEDCIVIGGVFASLNLELNNSIVGTFNSSLVRISKTVQLLLPSAFTVEKINFIPGSEMYNLCLADLGGLFRGTNQAKNSGKIKMNLEADEIKSVLRSESTQQVIRSYSVIGKVLAADLLDMDKFNNHFLLTASALGPQLLKTYDFGDDNSKKLTIDNISNFFFDVLYGKIEIQNLEGNFSLSDIIDTFKVSKDNPTSDSINVNFDVEYTNSNTKVGVVENTSDLKPEESVVSEKSTENATEQHVNDTEVKEDVKPNASVVTQDEIEIVAESVICSNCSSPNDPKDTFCMNCGHSLQAAAHINSETKIEETSAPVQGKEMKCAKCGSTHTEEDVFCMNCGNKLK